MYFSAISQEASFEVSQKNPLVDSFGIFLGVSTEISPGLSSVFLLQFAFRYFENSIWNAFKNLFCNSF